MTLRRRLTAAAALAVAAVAITLGVVGYLTTRSHLLSELQGELRQRAAGFLQPHGGGHRADLGQPAGQNQPGQAEGADNRIPPAPHSEVRRATSSPCIPTGRPARWAPRP